MVLPLNNAPGWLTKIHYFECGGLRETCLTKFWSVFSSVSSRHHQKTVLIAKNKHVWFELYKSCYSQLGGECHISRIGPILDGIKPALSISGLENFEFGGFGGVTPENMLFMV